jgi:hypothetical protein
MGRARVSGVMFPKPKDIKKVKPAVKVMRDGREICQLLTKAGRDEYDSRKDKMHARQAGICCLLGKCPTCPGRLSRKEGVFEHEDGRTSGHRDDRIEVPVLDRNGQPVIEGGKLKMRPINGLAHPQCNIWKGSRRISYNDIP